MNEINLLRAIAKTTTVLTIEHAIETQDESLVWLALQSEMSVGNIAFVRACEIGFTYAVKQLLPCGVDVNKALRKASQNGHLDVVNLLLADSRVNPSADCGCGFRGLRGVCCAIGLASQNGHLDVVKLLLADPRVSAGIDGALGEASRNGHLDIVKLLLADPRINPSANDNYAIRLADGNGHLGIAKLLLPLVQNTMFPDDYYALKVNDL